jgi:two-component system chemotaxis response regulator CheB
MIVIGGSAGSMAALAQILPLLPHSFPLPLVIAQHLHPLQNSSYLEYWSERCRLRIKEAADKAPIEAGTAYFAPPNYHLLIEDNRILALSIDEKVNYSRPSIDVLFQSAADAYGARAAGVILTGANADGAFGLRAIKARGGLAIVQDPRTAEKAFMPKAALTATTVDHVLPLPEIGPFLLTLVPPCPRPHDSHRAGGTLQTRSPRSAREPKNPTDS